MLASPAERIAITEKDAPTLRRDAQVIALVGVAHATSHFFHLVLAPLFPWLKNAFSLSYGELGLLMTAFFIISAVGQALSGFIVDRVGAYPVHLIGLGLLGCSAFGLASSQNYWMLVFFEIIAGLGNCVFHPSGFTILNKCVSNSRLGHAFSMHGVSGTLGWAIAPLLLAGIATISSWRVALMVAGVLAFSVLGLLVVGRNILDKCRTARCARNMHPTGEKGTPLAFISVLGVLSLPGVWMCFSFFLITAMSNGGIQSFAPLALRGIYGVPVALASACVTAYMVANAAGMLWGGFLAARTSHHEKIIAIAFAAAGMIAVLVASAIVPGPITILLLALIGFGAGVAGPSRDLLVRAAAPEYATGRVYGVVYSGLDIGLSLAPILFGKLMDSNSPRSVFVLIGVFQTMAIVTAIKIGTRKPKAVPAPA
jgi:MFS transporter, FSR family, fosmidomycin resistance protein